MGRHGAWGAVVLAWACDAGGGSSPSAGASDAGPESGLPTVGGPAAGGPTEQALPFEGTLTLDEFDWIREDHLGVIRVELPSGAVSRFLVGRDGRHHPSGDTVFIQGCGADVGRVALADERGADIRVITPCSSEITNPSCCSATDFTSPVLSPDQTKVAVEGRYYDDGPEGFGLRHVVLVYDLEGEELGGAAGWDPAWTPDGRLVLGEPDGLVLGDAVLSETEPIGDGQLNGPAFGPAVHPSGERVLFEYNQRLWEIDLDGTDLQEVAFGSVRLSSPAYSPDGNAIVFLGQETVFDTVLLFKNLGEDEYYYLDIREQLSTSGVPYAPLSWSP